MLVGTEANQRRFTVYHDLVTNRSEFFRAARSERWTKDPSKPAELKDHEPEIFATYLHCVYFNRIQEQAANDADVEAVKNSPTGQQGVVADALFESRVKLYLLADEMQDRITTNLASDDIIRLAGALALYPSASAITLAYASTLDGSNLRKLLVDLTLHDNPDLPKGEYPSGFFQDLVEEYNVQRRYIRREVESDAQSANSLLDWTVCGKGEKEDYHHDDDDNDDDPRSGRPTKIRHTYRNFDDAFDEF